MRKSSNLVGRWTTTTAFPGGNGSSRTNNNQEHLPWKYFFILNIVEIFFVTILLHWHARHQCKRIFLEQTKNYCSKGSLLMRSQCKVQCCKTAVNAMQQTNLAWKCQKLFFRLWWWHHAVSAEFMQVIILQNTTL